jgi:hypothetical protein
LIFIDHNRLNLLNALSTNCPQLQPTCPLQRRDRVINQVPGIQK